MYNEEICIKYIDGSHGPDTHPITRHDAELASAVTNNAVGIMTLIKLGYAPAIGPTPLLCHAQVSGVRLILIKSFIHTA